MTIETLFLTSDQCVPRLVFTDKLGHTMFGISLKLGEADDDMAKNVKFDEAVVARHLANLGRTNDERNFHAAIEQMKSDPSVGKPEALEIAARYVGRGRKVVSKKAAVEAIVKRFVESSRMRAKLVIAEKERPI